MCPGVYDRYSFAIFHDHTASAMFFVPLPRGPKVAPTALISRRLTKMSCFGAAIGMELCLEDQELSAVGFIASVDAFAQRIVDGYGTPSNDW